MIPRHKGEIPVVLLLLPFLTGIITAITFFPQPDNHLISLLFAALCLIFITLNFTYRRFNLYKYRWWGGVLIILILFSAGLASVGLHNELNKPDHFSKKPAQYLLIKINNEPALKNGLTRFTAKVEACVNDGKRSAASGSLLVTVKDSLAKNLYYGYELLIPAKYNIIDPPFNPAEFNYKKYLADKNIYFQAFLYPKQYAVVDTNAGNPFTAKSLRIRQRLVAKLKQNMRDTDAMAVASTLLLGYKADLSSDVLDVYKTTGTVYVLSVSGAQVAAIYLLLSVTLGFFKRYKYGKIARAVLIIAVIWYYAVLTGFSLSVCRVAVMVSMVIAGKSFNRYISTLNILAISAFVLLLYNPFFISEVGFQLSYIAVAGLILWQPIVYSLLKFKNKWADKIWALCSVSIAIQAAILPIDALYFHQFPVYFLVSSLFVVIPATVMMYSGILYLLLPPVHILSPAVAFILEKTTRLMNKGLTFIEHAPFSAINKIWISGMEYLLLYAIVITLFFFLYHKKVWQLRLCLGFVLLLCLSFSARHIDLKRSDSIVWLNLKKHKGIIFRNSDKALILTDIKQTDKTFQYSVQPYLDSCNLKLIAIRDLNQDVQTPWLIKKGGLIAFGDKKIFIQDGHFQNDITSPKIKTDYVYITNDADTGLRYVNANFEYKMLIADGSNSDKTITQMKASAEREHVAYKILKRNNSFVSTSN